MTNCTSAHVHVLVLIFFYYMYVIHECTCAHCSTNKFINLHIIHVWYKIYDIWCVHMCTWFTYIFYQTYRGTGTVVHVLLENQKKQENGKKLLSLKKQSVTQAPRHYPW